MREVRLENFHMIECSVRCPRCGKVKERMEFKQSNIKWHKVDTLGCYRMPVCNECHLEIIALRVSGKEVVYN
jgi:hypothetical protein